MSKVKLSALAGDDALASVDEISAFIYPVNTLATGARQ
jgi:hypothetical protein